jgi:hypothetical protein
MTKESSVSRFAERELRFVEPNSVSSGGAVCVGETQMPVQVADQIMSARNVIVNDRVTFGMVRPRVSMPLR